MHGKSKDLLDTFRTEEAGMKAENDREGRYLPPYSKTYKKGIC